MTAGSPVTGRQGREILSAARGKKIVVVGDLMLDQFIWGTVDRISPEAPVPVVKVARESHRLGGAGNVARNISALGAAPAPVGVTGTGRSAAWLREEMERAGLPVQGVLAVDGRETTVKTRVVAHNQQVVRYDREQDDPLDEAAAGKLVSTTLGLLGSADALIISDYDKGCLSARVLELILPEVAGRDIPVVVDPKPAHWRSYTPCTVVTPNQPEAALMTGRKIRSDDDALASAVAVREALGCRGVLLTRGDKGMLLVERDQEPRHVAAAAREVFDVTGAGDTVVAALAVCLAAGASLGEAAILANAAAGVVVGKIGTAVTTPDELLAAL